MVCNHQVVSRRIANVTKRSDEWQVRIDEEAWTERAKLGVGLPARGAVIDAAANQELVAVPEDLILVHGLDAGTVAVAVERGSVDFTECCEVIRHSDDRTVGVV